MLYHLSVGVIELASLTLFILAFRHRLRYEKQKAVELFFAFVYGLLLEELDMYFFRTYHYGPGFFLQLGRAPLAIAFLWSLIVTSSMAISDRLRLPEFAKPFLDGLLALLVDIGVDAIAIRIGYWTWAIPLKEGWFGVPAGNLYSWMWVAFSYSLATRIVRRVAKKDRARYLYQVLVPFAAYLFLFIVIAIVGLLNFHLGLARESEKLWVFYVHVCLFSLIVVGGAFLRRKGFLGGEKIPEVFLWSRLLIHIYFLIVLLVTGMILKIPLLGLVAFSAFILEGGIRKIVR